MNTHKHTHLFLNHMLLIQKKSKYAKQKKNHIKIYTLNTIQGKLISDCAPWCPAMQKLISVLKPFMKTKFFGRSVLKKNLWNNNVRSQDNTASIMTRLHTNHNKGKRFSLLKDVQTGSGAHPASYGMGTGVLSWGYSSQSMKATTHLKLVTRLKRSTAIPPLLLCLHGSHRETSRFTFY